MASRWATRDYKKGDTWCGKKTKTAKKYSKFCPSGKAKKCEATCCQPYE